MYHKVFDKINVLLTLKAKFKFLSRSLSLRTGRHESENSRTTEKEPDGKVESRGRNHQHPASIHPAKTRFTCISVQCRRHCNKYLHIEMADSRQSFANERNSGAKDNQIFN